MKDLKSTALLVMDLQEGIVDRIDEDKKKDFLEKVKSTVSFAHKNNILVIYVVVGFRYGFPEISKNNKAFNAMKENFSTIMINPVPVIKLEKNDILVTKHRFSAFSGSDLDTILRSNNITHLVLSGISTSGVVLSTTREAADKDFEITILSDLCFDFDEEVHNILINKIFPRQANIVTSEEWGIL